MTDAGAKRKSLPLGRRISLLVALIAVVLAFLLQVVGLLVSRDSLEADQRQSAAAIAALLAPGVENALLTGNTQDLPALLANARRAHPDLVYAVVCSRGGTPVAHDSPAPLPGDLEKLVQSRSVESTEATLFNVATEKGALLHLVQPLENGKAGYLHLGLSWAPVDAALGQACTKLLIAMLGGLLASGLVAWVVYRRLARRIVELTAAAREFGEGKLATRVSLPDGPWDEADILAQTLNQMAARLDHQFTEQMQSWRALAHAEKLSVVGQLAAGVAHEINSPLDGAIEASRILERNAGDPDKVRRFAQAQRAGLERIAAIVRRLLTFSRLPSNRPRGSVTVWRLLDEAQAILKHRILQRKVVLDLSDSQDRELLIPGDELSLVQVVVNLLNNAIDVTPEGGTVKIGVHVEPDAVEIAFTDQGPGVPEEAASKMFTPFFTTKEVGKGTGLGLAISRHIAKEHRGAIEFANLMPPWGARFTLTLPRREAAAVEAPQEPAAASKS